MLSKFCEKFYSTNFKCGIWFAITPAVSTNNNAIFLKLLDDFKLFYAPSAYTR